MYAYPMSHTSSPRYIIKKNTYMSTKKCSYNSMIYNQQILEINYRVVKLKYYIVMKELLLHAIIRTNFTNMEQKKPDIKQ